MIKAMTLWNQFVSIKQYVFNYCYRGWCEMAAMYQGTYHIWSLGHHPLPLSYQTVPKDKWLYHSHIMSYDRPVYSIYQYSWLSVKLVAPKSYPVEYSMDDFFNALQVHTNSDFPTISMLIQAWSIDQRIWFNEDQVELHIIDHKGEERILYHQDYLFYAEKHKIYLKD